MKSYLILFILFLIPLFLDSKTINTNQTNSCYIQEIKCKIPDSIKKSVKFKNPKYVVVCRFNRYLGEYEYKFVLKSKLKNKRFSWITGEMEKTELYYED
jgi:hypothetical protein